MLLCAPIALNIQTAHGFAKKRLLLDATKNSRRPPADCRPHCPIAARTPTVGDRSPCSRRYRRVSVERSATGQIPEPSALGRAVAATSCVTFLRTRLAREVIRQRNMFVAPIDRRLHFTIAARAPTVDDGRRTIGATGMFLQCLLCDMRLPDLFAEGLVRAQADSVPTHLLDTCIHTACEGRNEHERGRRHVRDKYGIPLFFLRTETAIVQIALKKCHLGFFFLLQHT